MKRFFTSILSLSILAFCIVAQGAFPFTSSWSIEEELPPGEILAASSKLRFEEDFNKSLDFENKWELSKLGYEWRKYATADVSGSFGIVDGQLQMNDMEAVVSYWGGRSIITKDSFYASKDSVLSISVDRPYMVKYSGVAVCNNLVLRNKDGSLFVAFRDDQGEGGWMVNTVIGESGTVLADSDGGSHRMKMTYDGNIVSFFVDDVQLSEIEWVCTEALYVELGFYAREAADSISGESQAASGKGAYDNLRVENISGNATLSGSTLAVMPGFTNLVDIIIPEELVENQDVTVYASIVNPAVAYIEGSTGGLAEIHFAKGGSGTQRINVIGTGIRGATKIYFTCEDVEFERILNVQGYEPPELLLSDSLETIDPAVWKLEKHTGAKGDIATCLTLPSTCYATADHPVVIEYEQYNIGSLIPDLKALSLLVNESRDFWGISYGHGNCSGWGICASDLSDSAKIKTLDAEEFQFGAYDTHKVRLVCDGNYATVYVDDYRAGRYAYMYPDFLLALSLVGKTEATEENILQSFGNVKVYGSSIIDVDTDSLLVNIGKTATFAVKVPESIRKLAPTLTLTIDDPTRAVFVGGNSSVSYQLTDNVTVEIMGRKVGSAHIIMENDLGVEMAVSQVEVLVSDGSEILLLDDLGTDGPEMDLTKWYINEKGYEYSQYPDAGGTTSVQIRNGVLSMSLDLNGGQYWGGRAYVTKDGYKASELSPLTFTVTRGSFVSSGSGGRCAFLVYKGSGSRRWVHFADIEDSIYYGWTVNKQTGESSDVSSGVGPGLEKLNNGILNDRREHEVKLVANGKTVAIYVDDVYGGEVNFAVSEDIHFGIAVYARAVGDTTASTFKGPITVTGFADPLPNPPVITENPSDVTVLEGESAVFKGRATDVDSYQWYKDGVAITGANQATYKISKVAMEDAGSYSFTASNRSGSVTSEAAQLVVTEKPKAIYTDSFTEVSVNENWTVDDSGLENISFPNAGATCSTAFGKGLSITVKVVSPYWPGRTYWLNRSFVATETAPLTITLKRSFYAGVGTGSRCAFCISNESGDKWFKFAESYDESVNAWGYNNHDKPEGSVIEMKALDSYLDKGVHDIKMVLNGKTVSFYVDEKLGGTYDYPVTENIKFGVAVFAREKDDRANARFNDLAIYGAGGLEATNADTEPSLTYSISEGKICLEFDGLLEKSLDGREWFALDEESPYVEEIAENENSFFRTVKK